MTTSGATPLDRPPLDRSTRVRRADGLLASEVDGEVVMMDVAQGRYFGLDPIGSDIWNRLERPVAVGDLVAALGERYDADPATIERDVLALLSDMAARGLVERCG